MSNQAITEAALAPVGGEVKVHVLLPIWPLEVGDVVDVPEEIAAFWSSCRMARLAAHDAAETAFLLREAKVQLLHGLSWSGDRNPAW
ncbi:hypothetical protein AB0A63_13910 [Lentzea sp. NPDC042327]|uniref:hypothetical protein n=1 Tax=Lentzea sp. NPDC042327 TaxID=3154801 RepID=UPI0033DA06AF